MTILNILAVGASRWVSPPAVFVPLSRVPETRRTGDYGTVVSPIPALRSGWLAAENRDNERTQQVTNWLGVSPEEWYGWWGNNPQYYNPAYVDESYNRRAEELLRTTDDLTPPWLPSFEMREPRSGD